MAGRPRHGHRRPHQAKLEAMGYAFASVVETVQLNKRLRRIVLEVPELDRLQLPKAGDAAVGIYFPAANRPKRPPPMDCRDGVWGYYDATTAPPGRTYSIRNHDPIANRINVDVVLHGHGVGSTWAQTAAVASEVVVAHARSWYRPVPSTDWQLLVADLAGLPAAARIVEELAPDNEAIAIVEVAEEADLEYLPHRTNVTVIATVGTGNGDGESVLAQLVAAQPLPVRSRLLLVRSGAVTRGAKVSARSTSLGCSAIRYPRLLAARLRGVG